jgi:hypothetical protein
MFSFDKLDNTCFLFGTNTTRHNDIHLIANLGKIYLEFIVILNDSEGVASNNKGQFLTAVSRFQIQIVLDSFNFFFKLLYLG